ncbi:hypothetical protein Sden_3008 [Shewanella denitrificans OS217]|uniref:Uncharacterized protein n=1 Tax=Shewanella denitrificans (strain OS217 / ATCC BAA-1090 / DSM 15013) TaxID=318161 RepID=Q12JU0_SHEDO|nr:hypothetical protein [Shewanella denitrificans]ABE56286.1 hypothetical protein Sden_3008 [Shewanella denitrificans OS217]
MLSYLPLFSINLKHKYFASSQCEGLSFHPSTKTLAQSRNTGVMFKSSMAGIQVLFDKQKLNVMQMYAADVDEPLEFEFYLVSDEPRLSDFSSLGLFRADEVLTFHKALDIKIADHMDESACYNLAKGAVVSSLDFQKKVSHDAEPMGDEKRLRAQSLFFIRLQLSPIDLSFLYEMAVNKPQPVQFLATIDNSRAHWEYRVNGPAMSQEFSIIDRQGAVNFLLKNIESCASGKSTAIFRSDAEIELKERAENHFQLIEKRASGNKVVISRLPVAQAGKGYQEVIDNKLIKISEIFVNF